MTSSTATREGTQAPVSFDPWDHTLMDDPYPTYARLRAEAPFYHNEQHDFWMLSRHTDILHALHEDGPFSNQMGVSLDKTAWGRHAVLVTSFLAMDPPRHMQLRSLVSRGFTPKRVAQMEQRIQQITDHYLDLALAGGGTLSFDWIAALAGKLPMDVISELVGVPESDRVEVRHLADLLVMREDGNDDVPAAGVEAAGKLFEYYGDHVAARRRRPTGDLVSDLTTAQVDGVALSDADIVSFLFLLVVAGNETTTKLLGNAMYHLTARPQLAERVFADPGLVPNWIEETLRFDNSTQMVARHLVQDVTFHGITAPAGARVVLGYGSANRDESVFPNPDVFDLDRPKEQLGRIMSFGGGRHFCMGSNLAKLEARVALQELIRRCRSVQVDHAGCERFYSSNVRGFVRVPVTVVAR